MFLSAKKILNLFSPLTPGLIKALEKVDKMDQLVTQEAYPSSFNVHLEDSSAW
ncbi:Uncharacterised protein, partial [Mesomycoplasma hyorhinis]